MTDKRVIFTDPNGNCCVMHPLPALVAGTAFYYDNEGNEVKVPAMSVDEIADKDVPTYRAYMLRDPDSNELVEEEDAARRRMNVPNLDAQLPYRVTDSANIPQDRTFRNAWTDKNDTPTVDVDMDKARAIHLSGLRMQRDLALAKLDIPYMRADEKGDAAAKATIIAEKAVLRDLPVKIEAAIAAIDTPEALAAYVPAELEAADAS